MVVSQLVTCFRGLDRERVTNFKVVYWAVRRNAKKVDYHCLLHTNEMIVDWKKV